MPGWFTRITNSQPPRVKQIGVWLKQVAMFLGITIAIAVVLSLIITAFDVGFTDSQTPWVIALAAIGSTVMIALLQSRDRTKHEKRVEKLLERILNKR